MPRTGPWPTAACSEKASALLAEMTLAEKVGQMTQAERGALSSNDIARYALGSVLSAGGSGPPGSTPSAWAEMLDEYHARALTSRLGIPLLYGVDAVHGHNNVIGAVIFPHNIGLGATRDPELVAEVARMTALEVAGTGADWTFSPVVAVGLDPRWGRTYETFSERPEDTALLGAAAIRGYQGERLGGDPTSVLACAKHFAGDGATTFGTSTMEQGLLDRGDTQLSEEEFRRLAIAPYLPAIEAGVGAIMVSYSSWNGVKLHGHRELVTDVLKGELGFRGLVVSDYQGIHELPGTYREQVVASVNAGIDLMMEADRFRDFIKTLTAAVEAGEVPMERIDDAVTRILTVKCEMGLFEKGPVDRSLTEQVGSAAHREVARRAVRQSLVLLKNEGDVLPLSKETSIVVAGSGADSLAHQAGGWTVGWQGAEDTAFPGTTVLGGLREVVSDPARITFSADGSEVGAAEVAVLVAAEAPYAEWYGDSADLALSGADVRALKNLAASGLPTVVVLLSGRPLIIEPHLSQAAAWIAAWLPGSEGGGVADVLFGDHAPSGKLPHAWPREVADLPLIQREREPLFPYGFGLGYGEGASD